MKRLHLKKYVSLSDYLNSWLSNGTESIFHSMTFALQEQKRLMIWYSNHTEPKYHTHQQPAWFHPSSSRDDAMNIQWRSYWSEEILKPVIRQIWIPPSHVNWFLVICYQPDNGNCIYSWCKPHNNLCVCRNRTPGSHMVSCHRIWYTDPLIYLTCYI